MKVRSIAASIGLLVGGVLALSAAPAQAFSFQTNFTPALTGKDAAKGDIILDSVTLEDGTVISDFVLIDLANIVSNDIFTGGNTGAASSDIGDKATTGLKQEDVTNEGIRSVLSNNNLDNIIDTEDKGNFIIDLFFRRPVDNVFVWERGMNSRLNLQGLSPEGNLIGNLIELNSANFDYAGFKIDTTEIRQAQRVGSIGISLADLGLTNPIEALRVSSLGAAFNGPDFKIIGSAAEPNIEAVPEPSLLLGIGAVVAGTLATRRRRQVQETQGEEA
ncbi:MAG: exosortase-dependent surface protein XDP2 [Phormidesmis sp.]